MSLSIVRNAYNLSRFIPNNRFLLTNSFSKSSFYYGLKNTRTLTRSLFFLSRNRGSDTLNANSIKIISSGSCTCDCGLHTKSDQELAAFLTEEIENEKKVQYKGELPQMEGYECTLEGSEVRLTKKSGNEIIIIKTNVNNSVDTEENVMDPNESQEPAEGQMKSKPDFTIEIKKNNKVLSFHCTYSDPMSEEPSNEAYNDSFQISEVSLHEGEFKDSTYFVSGDVMDGYLYDLLMNYLEERGISNEFADKMITLFTAYEQKLYINLLQGMKTFVEK